jgi:hypothetical protein
MNKRNIGAILIVLSVVVVFSYFFVLPALGNMGNPFGQNVAVHVHTQQSCTVAWVCWWDDTTLTIDYSTKQGLVMIPKPLGYYCGWGGSTQPVVATLYVTGPDNVQYYQNQQSQQSTSCNNGLLDFYWTSSLSHGHGIYQIKVHICGNAFWGQTCHDLTGQVTG